MGDPRPLRLRNVTVDARDPRALAEFYRRLTGWAYTPGHEVADPTGDDWLSLQVPGGASRLAFQRS
ncbi:MAG: VOC family protein, partial [Cellulosimicrobium funkei]